jgi:hypothetical protein
VIIAKAVLSATVQEHAAMAKSMAAKKLQAQPATPVDTASGVVDADTTEAMKVRAVHACVASSAKP